ncbi:MAG: hypothetical protein Q9164_006532, partial [Protoblastenia rupestris]
YYKQIDFRVAGALDYCNVYDASFCLPCWQQKLAHKKRRLAPASIPHEKTSFVTAAKIQAVIEPRTSPAEQDALPQSDEDTTWFGVVRDDDAQLLLFLDHGRYARIMAEDPKSVQDHRCPSLVSFVGQIDARKMAVPNSKRWAGRRPSQQVRRNQWTPPELSQGLTRMRTIPRYSEKDYVLGDSSRSRLQNVPDRLSGRNPNIHEMHAGTSLPRRPVELPADDLPLIELPGDTHFQSGNE